MNKTSHQIMMHRICLIVIVPMLLHSCKSRHAKQASMIPETIVVHDTTIVNSSEKEQIFRVVVSFISRGEGTDQNARPMLDSYVTLFQEKYGLLAINQQLPWGREGEVDNCFLLNDFSPMQQITFIQGLNDLFKENDLVHIDENQRKPIVK